MNKTCSLPDCNLKHKAHGFCDSHYNRYRKYGDPYSGKTGFGEAKKWIIKNKNHISEDCLMWPYSKYPNGYGMIGNDGSTTNASRVMCIVAHGLPKSDDMEAAHSCGKGHLGCVNPNHLSWKTPKENASDKIIHGTVIQGENSLHSKLNESQVIEIFKRAKKGENQTLIANDYGISRRNVSNIKNKVSWKYLTEHL
jgi:hypothetical protein